MLATAPKRKKAEFQKAGVSAYPDIASFARSPATYGHP